MLATIHESVEVKAVLPTTVVVVVALSLEKQYLTFYNMVPNPGGKRTALR